jgi:hypothetical protein
MTDRQKQHLLAYLGFYTGAVDGIWGPQSIKATKAFQNAYMDSADGLFGQNTENRILKVIAENEKPKIEENFWDEIRYFTREEFRCTCGGRGCSGFPAEPVERLIRNAEAARIYFGAVADVSSGVRCPLRNGELPGSAQNSLHMRGKAMDFRIRGIPAYQLLEYVRQLPGVDEAYAIDDAYVHMGVDKYKGGEV